MVSTSGLRHLSGSDCHAQAQVLDGDVMSLASSSQSSDSPHVVLNHSADYGEFVEAQFIALAMREGLLRLRGLSWPTQGSDLESIGEVLSSAMYDHDHSHRALVRLPTALGLLVIQQRRFFARLAAVTEHALDEAESGLREAFPVVKPPEQQQQALVAFWRADQLGGQPAYGRLMVPTWDEICGNYAAETRHALDGMMRSFRPGHGGRLLLWNGPPGTGKTYALRALAWEWRKWCSVHYITDPEALFGSNTGYLMQVLMRGGPSERWRLLVLEDTGELLSADAKLRTGQGLSRLLNVVDGLMGQEYPTLVLVTTNEPMRSFHPAIARPGRCALHIEFKPLGKQEAQAWLASRDMTSDDLYSRTLAELFAIADGFTVDASHQPVGFA